MRRGSIPGRGKRFVSSPERQTGSETHSSPYSNGRGGGSYSRRNATEAWSWLFSSPLMPESGTRGGTPPPPQTFTARSGTTLPFYFKTQQWSVSQCNVSYLCFGRHYSPEFRQRKLLRYSGNVYSTQQTVSPELLTLTTCIFTKIVISKHP